MRTSTWQTGVVRIVSRPESEVPNELRLRGIRKSFFVRDPERLSQEQMGI
jgi:hypothetical protein